MSALLPALLAAVVFMGLLGSGPSVRAEQGEAESAEFVLDLTLGRGAIGVGQGTAASGEFWLDLRGVAGPTLHGSWAESGVFTVNLLGVEGGLAVAGRVYDRASGLGLSGAVVELDTLSTGTDGHGNYAFGSVPIGEYALRASASGYVSFNGTVVVPGGTTVRRDISLSAGTSGLRVADITCRYPGFLHFLDGPAFNVTFTATVDWAGHPPGWVEFLTPKGTWTVAASGTTASQTFNMGGDFGANGKLRVVAVSSDGTRSAEKLASLVVMPAPIPGIGGAFLEISDEPDGFAYKPTDFGGVNMSFFDEAIDAGVLPESIPLFGEKPVALSFIPEMTFTIDSKGVADFEFRWDDAEFGKLIEKEWGREHNLRKMIDMLTDRTQKGLIDKRRLPKAAVASMELHFFPIAGGQFQFNRESEQWEVKGFSAGLAGEFNLEKSWPFVFFAGPVPVPMYAKAGLDINAEAELQMTSLNPISPSGVLTLEPYVRGSLGVGID
ncbi:MAG TPA: carboxypeptidase-like regulatory domain-containing protein [Verrucomicrobiota bacterium]|nr:carboxypeptidase-like regulatory domain-containing protein [Verrucomicrobiota bacterium]HQL78550.1 carboxypeptidase-like regulatory domain-containing protein [Verrucomicrobiota bacterium]